MRGSFRFGPQRIRSAWSTRPTTLRRMSDLIRGHVHPRFHSVRDELFRSLRNGSELGAGVCVWYEGEVVVDLACGMRDRERHLPFELDTLSTMFSSTKGMVALCFLMLADRGRLDYDAPISNVWPAFASPTKRMITTRMLLNHRSGLIALPRDFNLDDVRDDPDRVRALLEEAEPAWEPGTHQGYHGVTYGLYTAELFKRLAGESVGTFFAREVARPLKADVYIGLPEALESRVAKNVPQDANERLRALPSILYGGGPERAILRQVLKKGDTFRAFEFPSEAGPSALENYNTRRMHALELPWGNGLGSARGLCRVYSALANGGSIDGVRLISEAALLPLQARESWTERDRVLCRPMGWTRGFVKENVGVFSSSEASFGHPGAGGALGWCDPTRKLAMAYLTTKMAYQVRSPRALALAALVDASVGKAR